MRLRFSSITLFGAAMLLLSSSSHAEMIYYRLTGVGSGTIGGVSFTDSTFAFYTSFDTENIVHQSSRVDYAPNTSSQIDLEGYGLLTLPEGLNTYRQNTSSYAVIGLGAPGSLYVFPQPEFLSRDLSLPMEETSYSTGWLGSWNMFPQRTEAGTLIFDSTTASVPGTLTISTTPLVPEPGTMLLVLLGSLLIGRRR